MRVQNVAKSAGPSGDGVLHSPGSAARDSSSAVRVEQARDMNGAKRPQMLPTPEEEVAGRVVTCDWEHRPPCRLMYATVRCVVRTD